MLAQTSKTAAQRLSDVAKVVLIGSAYIAISAGLIAFNKHLMHKDRFPHAMCLTAMHMSVTFILALCLYAVAPRLYPTMDVALANKATVLKYIAPLGMLFALALYCSNSAYLYCSVAFLQFMKEGNVAIVFVLSCLVGLQRFSWTKTAVLFVVASGCSLCVHGEMKFVMLGFSLQLASQLAECSKNIIGELVMTGAGLKLDVLTFVLFQAPCSLVPLLIGVAATWQHAYYVDFIAMWPVLLLNAGVAFLLNLLIALTLKELSALAFVIIGITKDMAIVVCSSFVFGDHIADVQRGGFAVTIVGITLWGMLKVQEQADKETFAKSKLQAATIEEVAPLLARVGHRRARDDSQC